MLLRPVPESRPIPHRFGGSALSDPATRQPSLLDALGEMFDDASTAPRPRGVAIRRDCGPGSVNPAAELPEPGGWVAVLGLAVGQALIGTRPLSQLESWLDIAVLADLRYAARRRLREHPRPSLRPAVPVRVVSVRAQCPTPTTVEASVHLRIGAGSVALGVRLEATGRRWLCTALARPQPSPSTPSHQSITGLRDARDTV